MSMYALLGTLGMLQLELEKVQLKREQLVLALKLFDLPVTPFPMLVEVYTFPFLKDSLIRSHKFFSVFL